MNTESLAVLCAVARCGSFAAHARESGADPSSVSRQIAALERELGFQVFERTTRRLSLTEAGRIYVGRVAPLLDAIHDARDAARDCLAEPVGDLTVTTSVAFGERWLMPRVATFREAYPKIDIELRLTDAVVDIAAEGIDVALRLGSSVSGAFVASKLLDTRYQVVAAPAYLKEYGHPRSLEELEQHTGLLFSLAGVNTKWQFRKDSQSPAQSVTPKASLRISNALAIRRAALDGLGLALLADWTVASDIETGGLVPILSDWEASIAGFATGVWVVYASRSYVPTRLRIFIDHLRANRLDPGGTVKL